MSWIKSLYDTYEKNQLAAASENSDAALLPIFHMTAKSHIEVLINERGEFLDAFPVVSENSSIVIPCTETSSSRAGSMPVPHPLNDKLQYLAKDYDTYGKKWHGYGEYLKLLTGWVEFSHENSKLSAIYKYLTTYPLMQDLIDHQIFKVEDHVLKWGDKVPKAPKVDAQEAVIRWSVEKPGVLESRTWKDKELVESWISYYLSTSNEKGFCYVLGKEAPLEMKHPKNVYNMCANAKLISSNDKDGYTYRGRLSSPQEGYGLSAEVSQKAHNALKWLIERQGYNKGKKTIVCWANAGEIPNVTDDALGFWDLDDTDDDSSTIDTAEEMSFRLRKKILGYRSNFSRNEKVNLLELESVTDGRLSITYFKEMDSVVFFDNLEKWHSHCQWIHRYRRNFTDKNPSQFFVGAPSPMNIAETVYGMKKNVDEKLKMKTVDRILMCIFEGSKIPQDMVNMAVRHVSNREGFKEDWEYEKALSITCALLKKYYYDYEEEMIKMALDKERTSRDYLYGRLLAVAQNIEQWALNKSGEKRMTNADRMMNRFSTHPYSTWRNIEMSLKPYLERLNGGGAASRERLIDEIMSLFTAEDFVDDRALSGEFLLGYHCQREELKKKKDKNDDINEEENGGNE